MGNQNSRHRTDTVRLEIGARAVADPVPTFGSSFTPVVHTTDVDVWHAQLSQLMGDCRIDLGRSKSLSFAAQISTCAIGALTLVELRSEGALLDLLRRQRDDTTVLWLPEQGAMEERVPGTGELWQPGPGQALWIAPGTELRGHTQERCAGVSILLPASLVASLQDQGGVTNLLNPFQTTRLPTLGPLLRSVRELITAARQQPGWLEASAGLFWQALERHCEQASEGVPMEPDGQQASNLSNQFLHLVTQRLQESPQARFNLGQLALALHVTPRTLQGHLRKELDTTPRQVWKWLQRERSASSQARLSGSTYW